MLCVALLRYQKTSLDCSDALLRNTLHPTLFFTENHAQRILTCSWKKVQRFSASVSAVLCLQEHMSETVTVLMLWGHHAGSQWKMSMLLFFPQYKVFIIIIIIIHRVGFCFSKTMIIIRVGFRWWNRQVMAYFCRSSNSVENIVIKCVCVWTPVTPTGLAITGKGLIMTDTLLPLQLADGSPHFVFQTVTQTSLNTRYLINVLNGLSSPSVFVLTGRRGRRAVRKPS